MATAAATGRGADDSTKPSWNSRPTSTGIALRSSRLLAAAQATSQAPFTSTPRSTLAARLAERSARASNAKPTTSTSTISTTSAPSTTSNSTTGPTYSSRTRGTTYSTAGASNYESRRAARAAASPPLSISFTNRVLDRPRRTATAALSTNLPAASSSTFASTTPKRDVFSPTRSTPRDSLAPYRDRFASSAQSRPRDVFSPTRAAASTTRTSTRTTSDYRSAPSRAEDRAASSAQSTSLSVRSAAVPDVLSRFGSRSPAFLAEGVVRKPRPSYSTQSSLAGLSRPIPKNERPWRMRMAESTRMRDISEGKLPSYGAPAGTYAGRTSSLAKAKHVDAVSAATPVSSAALRNYESKFAKAPAATPAYLSALASAKVRFPASRPSSSTASSTRSLFSPLGSPRYLSPTFAHGSLSPSRPPMTRSLYISSSPTYHAPSRMSMSYTPSDFKRMGEGTKWVPVDKRKAPVVEERKSREPETNNKDRSRSRSRRARSRSRSVANEPPLPGSSSDSDPESAEERVGRRKKRLVRKTSVKKTGQPTLTVTAPTTMAKPKAGSPDAKTVIDKSPKSTAAPSSPVEAKPANVVAKPEPVLKSAKSEDKPKYNAVATFKPVGVLRKKLADEARKPVPGSWNGENERFISSNKNFVRKPAAVQVEVAMKHIPHAKTSSARFKAQKKRKVVVPLSSTKIVNASFMRPKLNRQTASIVLPDRITTSKTAPQLSVKAPATPKPPPKLAECNVNEHLVKNKQLKINVERKFPLRTSGRGESATLKCACVSDVTKVLNMSIQRKTDAKSCNGTVRDCSARPPVNGVNFARVSSDHLEEPVNVHVTLARPPQIVTIPPDGVDQYDGFSSPEPYEKELHVPLPARHQPGGPLILPDQSVLEEYVKRKRNHLATICEDKRNASDANNTVSAGSVLHLPRRLPQQPHQQQHITSPQPPSRLSSTERTDENMTPRPNDPVQLGQPPSAAAAPPANILRKMLRKTSDPSGGNRLAAMKNVFDTPKSPFEEAMQRQAKKVTVENEPDNPKWKRRSMDSDLAQGFQAQAAAQQARHAERYAAHIPVPVSSGRQSVTSVDSVQSGVLDAASRQLDTMIDQARHKHQRTRFKEAIDYLDQIFDDLKKECEPASATSTTTTTSITTTAAAEKRKRPDKFPVQSVGVRAKSPAAAAAAKRPVLTKSVSQDAGARQRVHPVAPAGIGRNDAKLVQNAKAPLKSARSLNSDTRQKLRKAESVDVEVTETIRLPSKSSAERLDYTKKWLQDDIKGWSEAPPKPHNELTRVAGDSDEEHSLGSCSAEVAAINADKRRAAKPKAANEAPKVVKPKKQQAPEPAAKKAQPAAPNGAAPLKPRAYRPNQQGAPLPFVAENAAYEGQKPAPHYIRPGTSDSVDRAGSTQDRQSQGSAHSNEGARPAFNSLQRTPSGAFVQFQRGSIQSLPDAFAAARTPQPGAAAAWSTSGYGSAATSQTYLQPPPSDPVGQMNALVAELDLQPDQTAEKRRSFPTPHSDAGPARPKPIASTTVRAEPHPPGPTRLQVPQAAAAAYAGSMDRGLRRLHDHQQQQQQPAPAFASSVQRPVAGSAAAQKLLLPRQKLEDATNLLDSVIDELHPIDGPRTPRLHKKQPVANNGHTTTNNNNNSSSSGARAPLTQEERNHATWQEKLLQKRQQQKQQQQQPAQQQQQQPQPQQQQQQPRPFQTINDEKLQPSRVAAVHNLFEDRRRSAQTERTPARQTSRDLQEPMYSEISEFQRPFQRGQSLTTNPVSRSDQRPQMPTTQPPSQARGFHSPPGKPQPQGVQRQASLRRPSQPQPALDRVSLGSQNLEDEENGFYDNIRVGGGAPAQEDQQSVTSRRTIGAPFLSRDNQSPKAGGPGARIGQLIRKLGGVPERPIVHQAAEHGASLLSLNRLAANAAAPPAPPHRPGLLMKSNSLSHEPWRIHAMDKDDFATDHNKSTGIGNRLKQTLFGSRKWLNN